MNGDAPRNTAPPWTSFWISLMLAGSTERRWVRSRTSSLSAERHVFTNSLTTLSSRRPATLTVVFIPSVEVSIRTVMRVCYCKHLATLDTLRRCQSKQLFSKDL